MCVVGVADVDVVVGVVGVVVVVGVADVGGVVGVFVVVVFGSFGVDHECVVFFCIVGDVVVCSVLVAICCVVVV